MVGYNFVSAIRLGSKSLMLHKLRSSLTMLGNTIFCIPGSQKDPTEELAKWGRVYELEVENKPARIFG
mgnify:CR=1 FL=1